jgi:hypothetical protein
MSITNRERFRAIAHSQMPGGFFYCEQVLPETRDNWIQQGAPKELLGGVPSLYGNDFFRNYFKLDEKKILRAAISGWAGGGTVKPDPKAAAIPAGMGSGAPLVPDFEKRIIAEDERGYTIINSVGQTVKVIKSKLHMPMFVGWPVKDWETWKDLKRRLDPFTPERWAPDWESLIKEANEQDIPSVLQVGGFYGHPRDWVGSINILYMFHDNPSLLEDMMDQLLYMESEIIKKVAKVAKVDEAYLYEDMAYKAGPLISPEMVRKYLMPRYKKLSELLHSYGIDIITVDCDGNVEQLIPLLLESGINCVWPLEQAAGNDAVALRKKYGKDLILSGAIDKRALIKGKEAIRSEVMSKVPFLLGKGAYFPSVDHAVPPDVTWENYCYYINTMREAAGLDKLAF